MANGLYYDENDPNNWFTEQDALSAMRQPMQAAPQPMPQQEGGWMQSPYGAQLMAALGNIGNSMARDPRRQDPIQAYQNAVVQQAQLRKQRQAIEQADPFYKFEEAKRRGHIPADMTYQDFEQEIRMYGRASPRAFAPKYGTVTDADGNERQVAMTPVFDPATGRTRFVQEDLPENFNPSDRIIWQDVGNERIGTDPMTGQIVARMPVNLRPGEEPDVRGAQEEAVQLAQTRANQVDTALDAATSTASSYTDAQEILAESRRFLQMLEDPDSPLDTGPISGLLYRVFGVGTEELAALNNEAIMQTLQNLGITNLAPVTEREFAEVARLWASIMLQETPAKGSIKQAIRRTERMITRMEGDILKQANRVRTYGGEGQYNDLVQTNTLLQDMLRREAQEATDEAVGGITGPDRP